MGIGMGSEDAPSRIPGQPEEEILEKKWVEARSWAKERIDARKYGLPKNQRPNRMAERAPKRLAGRFHQTRKGHFHTGQYLKWAENAERA